jgi:hypothetical protein
MARQQHEADQIAERIYDGRDLRRPTAARFANGLFLSPCPCSNLHKAEKDWRFARAGRTVTVMVAILCALVSIFEFRVRSRASSLAGA